MLPIQEIILLGLAAVLAGAINSIAGGGTLLTFPALTWSLGGSAESLIIANATSTIALCPGSFSSAWAYRKELSQYGKWLTWLLPPSLLGSLLGVSFLLYDSPDRFKVLVPWLILLATVLFAIQPRISRWLASHAQPSPHADEQPISDGRLFGIMFFQFWIGVYGGYFGAGIGILTLSALGMMGMTDIHGMNAVKTVLATLINLCAILMFVLQDMKLLPAMHTLDKTIDWQRGIPMIICGIIGGYLGARVARRLNRNVVRYLIVLIGAVLATFYFVRLWNQSA
jgi:uncharacterized protein